MQPEETTDLTAREQQAATIRLRLRLAGATIWYDRPVDPVDLIAWILTGDRNARAMPTTVGLDLRWKVLRFVAAEMAEAEGQLGTVRDPIAAAQQLLAWLSSDTIGRLPRHYQVTLSNLAPDVVQAANASQCLADRIRVLHPPAERVVASMPGDVLC